MKKFLILLLCIFTTDSFASGIGNVSSAPCDNDTLNKYTGTANVEINWEPNTINLNWYDGDTKLTVANNSQTCVYDGTLTVPTQPTKPGYTFNGWKVIRVPGGFTELEYIESTGTQYINTGFKFTGNVIKYDLVYVVPVEKAASSLFGASDGDTQWTGIPYYTSGNGALNRLAIGNTVDANTTTEVAGTTYTYSLTINRVNHTYEMTKNGITYSGTFVGPISNSTNIALFAHNSSGTIWQYANYKNYGFKITEDGVLKRNFIPARRNSDNVVGVYDSITGTFFTNAGTGDFIAGPVVQ